MALNNTGLVDYHDPRRYTMKAVHEIIDMCRRWDVDGYEFQLVVRLINLGTREHLIDPARHFDVDLLKIAKHLKYHVKPILRVLRFWRDRMAGMEIEGSVKCLSCSSAYPITMLSSF